jgi:WD40 repeat protein
MFMASCSTIQGDLELLVDDLTWSHTPAWSSDCSRIYYSDDNNVLWRIDLASNNRTKVTDEPVGGFDYTPHGDLALSGGANRWIIVFELDTWTRVDSVQFSPDAQFDWSGVHLRFSYESSQIIYYCYKNTDTIFLRRINLDDSTDELLVRKGLGACFAPGPGDTLVALWDTVYNLRSGERVPLPVEPQSLQWNPAVPGELLISTWHDSDLFLFDVGTRKMRRVNAGPPGTFVTEVARFSPDGKKIVLVATQLSSGKNQIWLFNMN